MEAGLCPAQIRLEPVRIKQGSSACLSPFKTSYCVEYLLMEVRRGSGTDLKTQIKNRPGNALLFSILDYKSKQDGRKCIRALNHSAQ